MNHRISGAALATALMGAALLGGCGQFRNHQGFVFDQTLADSVQPGIDNRESVTRTLGRPTFAGEFDDKSWYYVSRETRQFAFRKPRPVEQTVLAIRFDQAGNVARVERTGMETVRRINPFGEETPTLGRRTTFFRELFGNIGQVGSTNGQTGTTADNPDG